MLHTLPKDNSTKADTKTQGAYSPEGYNSKGTKTKGDKQGGSRSETSKYPGFDGAVLINGKK